MTSNEPTPDPESTLDPAQTLPGVLRRAARALAALTALSAGINVLMLAAPLYMLQVFDRVLTSRSFETLVVLTLMVSVALATLAALEATRTLAIARLSGWLGAQLESPAFAASVRAAPGGASALTHLRVVRGFITGPSMNTVLDLVWVPLFMVMVFWLHPTLGLLAVVGALVLLGGAALNEAVGQRAAIAARRLRARADLLADSARTGGEQARAMGLDASLGARWRRADQAADEALDSASLPAAWVQGTTRFARLVLQCGVLGTGAWLVVLGELSAGAMIAATILLGRALAPVDQAGSAWRNARQAASAARELQRQLGLIGRSTTAPAAGHAGQLTCENVMYGDDGAGKPRLSAVSFELPAGRTLGVIGPTDSGKTLLARLLVGIESPRLGGVRLDGRDVAALAADDRRQAIGYAAQRPRFFAGTVRENIARMGEVDDAEVLDAAQLTGAHEPILRLPDGYETVLDADGARLSCGLAQRISLARAFYGKPALVVLDEPDAHLDQAGFTALRRAIAVLSRHGSSVVVISHQPAVVDRLDYLAVLGGGTLRLAGPATAVLARLTDGTPTREALGRA